MPTRTIDTKVQISGEKEYRNAVSEINSGLKVLNSEMKLVSAQFSDNADSVEALTAKHDVLGRQVLSQKEKIETLRAALKDSAEAFGEGDKRTMAWQASLNKAETELIGMEKELKDNKEALDKTNASMKNAETSSQKTGSAFGSLKEKFSSVMGESTGLGTAVNDLAGKFGVQLPEGVTSSLDSMAQINPAALTAIGGIAALAAAVVKAEKALWSMTEASAGFADNILTLSAQTGLSTEALQEFEYASELLDVSVDTLQGTMTKLTNNMQTARDGSGAAHDAFATLGVGITNTDGSLRSANGVFTDTIDALGRVQNVTERDALAMDIFGRSAQDLNPLIIQGSEALDKYAKEAHDVGYVLDEEMLDALGAVDDAQQRLLKTQEAVSNQISAEYAPYMAEALGDTRDFIQDIGESFRDSGIVTSFGQLLTAASGLLEPAGELIKFILPGLSAALGPVAEGFALISDTLTVITGMLTLNGDLIKKGLGLGITSGNMSATQALKYKDSGWIYNEQTGQWEGNYGHNAAGDYNWRGGMSWVGENGPELAFLPQGSRIYTSQESRDLGGDIYYINIDARSIQEFEDIVRIARERRRITRMGGGN